MRTSKINTQNPVGQHQVVKDGQYQVSVQRKRLNRAARIEEIIAKCLLIWNYRSSVNTKQDKCKHKTLSRHMIDKKLKIKK